jgi:hypothetical protein
LQLRHYAFLPVRKGTLTVKKVSTSVEREKCFLIELQEGMTLDAEGFATCTIVLGA